MKKEKRAKQAVFNRLSKEKQEKIMHASIEEFAHSGFELASTNVIAKKAGIAKGSLFQYFGTKENLFFSVAGHVLGEYIQFLRKQIPALPPDLLERFIVMQEKIYEFFGQDPVMFRFFKRVLTERGGAVHVKLHEQWEPLTDPIFMEFLEGADLSKLAVPVKDLMQVIEWMDFAVDSDIMSEIDSHTTVEQLKSIYRKKMELFYKVLKHGIYKKGA